MGRSGTMLFSSPLPQRYLTDASAYPGVGGRIKVRPEDFLVDELPLYEPSGTGEHLYLGIQKTSVSHAELLAALRRHFKVTDRAIGFAGMKDKHGVTRQTISIHLLRDPETIQPAHDRIQVLWSARHRNKLRLGHLAGNRFSIRVRDVDPLKAPLALKTLRRLEAAGMPNYFGVQRFGYRRNNHLLGAAMLRGEWDVIPGLLLGTVGGDYPAYQRERRELFDAGRFDEAAQHWTAADRAERIVCQRLASGRDAREACLGVGENFLAFWISAFQSAIFNRVLDARLEEGSLTALFEGDIAFKHATRGMFHVTAEELRNDSLAARLAAMEISPSGPLWGAGMMRPAGRVLQMEIEALEAAGITEAYLLQSRRSPEGGRRPLRISLRHPSLDSGVDEHGPYMRVAFDLPRGAYATVVMREIMKNDHAGDETSEATDEERLEELG